MDELLLRNGPNLRPAGEVTGSLLSCHPNLKSFVFINLGAIVALIVIPEAAIFTPEACEAESESGETGLKAPR